MLNNLPVLDFTISIVFVFFLFSLLAASLLELVNTVKKRRSRMLRDAIDKVFNDPKNKNFAELLYIQPIISASRKDAKSLPSYLSAEDFTSALIDVITEEGRIIKIGMNAAGTEQEVITNTLPSADGLENFRKGLATLQPSDLNRLLTSLSQFVKDSEELNKKLSSWYNNYMDRVSGWFKTKSNKILFVLSAIVVLFVNVDFFHLANEFWNNDDLRNQIVASAVQSVDEGISPKVLNNFDSVAGPQVTDINELKEELRLKYNAAEEVYKDINSQNIPVGWNIVKANFLEKTRNSDKFWIVIFNLFGLLISTLAISRGAPFWFDTLSKLVNLRNSGKKPEPAKA
jgi:hypothetical protein